jgi:hypothetical protein
LQRKQQVLDKRKTMSQFDLTPEEDAMVLSALRAKAANYLATYGVFDPALEELIDKLDGQLPAPVVEEAVAETPPDVVEPTEAEIEAEAGEEKAANKGQN